MPFGKIKPIVQIGLVILALAIVVLVRVLFWRHTGGPDAQKPIKIVMDTSVSIEELLQDEEVANLLSRHKRRTTLLRPHKSDKEIDFRKSKMGGMPNLNGFQAWPMCDECNKPLDFVMQLYRTDFPSFYFPEDRNIFQLFRCPNGKCPVAYRTNHYDHKMFHYYWEVEKDKNNEVEIPRVDSKRVRDLGDEKVQECYFEPEVIDDYPDYQDYHGDEWANFENRYGSESSEKDGVITITDKGSGLFLEKFSAKRATKFGGYPSWSQSSEYPVCECGSKKEFFFQLTGHSGLKDHEDYGIEGHGIFIGDFGSIYYFRCKKCGEKSIESRWDCT